MLSITSVLQMGKLLAYEQGLKPAAAKAVMATARDIRTDAQANARRKTGSMAESVYISPTPDVGKSDYDAAVSAAQGANPKVGIVSEGQPSGRDLDALVGVAAKHGIYLDRGTSRIPPDGWFTKAVEAHRQPYIVEVARALKAGL